MTTTTPPQSATGERADLLDVLRKHRSLFLVTVDGITDEQARTRSTVSELTLGGLVKHVAAVERQWVRFIQEGPDTQPEIDWANVDWRNTFSSILRICFEVLSLSTRVGSGCSGSTTVPSAMVQDSTSDRGTLIPPFAIAAYAPATAEVSIAEAIADGVDRRLRIA